MASDFFALQEPWKDGAIRTVNFFNGRLLTGADMGREQAARRAADAQTGRALGDGVADGLEVRFLGNVAPGARPAVSVTAGVAVNRLGAALCLPEPVRLSLDRPPPPGGAEVECLFGDCQPLSDGAYVAGQGLYLLTIAPAFTTEGRAQVSGMGDAAPRCAIDATVEAVQFRLLEVRPELFGSASAASARFRNAIAHEAFGVGSHPDWAANLLAQDPRKDDLIERLRRHGLEDSEVPLALIAFTSAGHQFTDMWSVRRPVCLRDERSVAASLSDPRRAALGRAMFRQFQDEIESLPALTSVTARGRFAFLPAAGILPGLNDSQVQAFFAGMTVRGPMHIDASAVEPLLRESLTAPAIDTASDHALWLYRIAQTRMHPERADLLIFASGHLPYRADARFNLNHWDYANYALIP